MHEQLTKLFRYIVLVIYMFHVSITNGYSLKFCFIFFLISLVKFTSSGKQYKDEAFLELPKDWTEGLNIKKKVCQLVLRGFPNLFLHLIITDRYVYVWLSVP